MTTPEGWQLVPVEPTEEMIEAGERSRIHSLQGALKTYRAMLAAAPRTEPCEEGRTICECPKCGRSHWHLGTPPAAAPRAEPSAEQCARTWDEAVNYSLEEIRNATAAPRAGPSDDLVALKEQIARDDEHYAAAMAMSEKHRKLWVEASQKLSTTWNEAIEAAAVKIEKTQGKCMLAYHIRALKKDDT